MQIMRYFTHNGQRYHYSTLQIAISIMAKCERHGMTNSHKYRYAQRVACCKLVGKCGSTDFIPRIVYQLQETFIYAIGGYPEVVGFNYEL